MGTLNPFVVLPVAFYSVSIRSIEDPLSIFLPVLPFTFPTIAVIHVQHSEAVFFALFVGSIIFHPVSPKELSLSLHHVVLPLPFVLVAGVPFEGAEPPQFVKTELTNEAAFGVPDKLPVSVFLSHPEVAHILAAVGPSLCAKPILELFAPSSDVLVSS